MDDMIDKRAAGALEQLRVSEVRYRRLFETAKDGVILLDADTGRITDVNPFLLDMLEYSHAELIGRVSFRQPKPVSNLISTMGNSG